MQDYLSLIKKETLAANYMTVVIALLTATRGNQGQMEMLLNHGEQAVARLKPEEINDMLRPLLNQ